MKNQVLKIISEFNALPDDIERYKFIKRSLFLILILDNDGTWAILNGDVLTPNLTEDEIESLPELNNFDDFLGCSRGIFSLLKAVGIEAESV